MNNENKKGAAGVSKVTQTQIDLLSTAPPETLAKVEVLSSETIQDALRVGREDRRAAEASEVIGPTDSRILFR